MVKSPELLALRSIPQHRRQHMFEPGHFHRSNSVATADIPLYAIDLHYDIRQDAAEGPMLHMTLKGEVDGTAFEESFELHRDKRRGRRYGLRRVLRVAPRHRLQLRQCGQPPGAQAWPADERGADQPRARGIRPDVRGHSSSARCPQRRSGRSRSSAKGRPVRSCSRGNHEAETVAQRWRGSGLSRELFTFS